MDELNETEEVEERCEYVDQGQCGRESGDGLPGELEMVCGAGRGDDIAWAGKSLDGILCDRRKRAAALESTKLRTTPCRRSYGEFLESDCRANALETRRPRELEVDSRRRLGKHPVAVVSLFVP